MQNIDFLFVEPGVTGIPYQQRNDVTLVKSKHARVKRFFRKVYLLTDRTEFSMLMHMLNVTRRVSGEWGQVPTSDIRSKTRSTHPASWQWRMIANHHTEFSYQTKVPSVILPACSGSLICVPIFLSSRCICQTSKNIYSLQMLFQSQGTLCIVSWQKCFASMYKPVSLSESELP